MRVAGGLLALAYSLAFFAICLGGCLGEAADTHACCKQAEGFTAANATSSDCCTVVSGVSSKVTTGVAAMPPAVGTWVPPSSALLNALPLPAAAVASSPPLVLRI